MKNKVCLYMSGDHFSNPQNVRREKLRVQGFDSAPPFQEEGEHHRQNETTGMLSEMFDFPPAEVLDGYRIRPPDWFPGRNETVTGDCRQQHLSADMQLFLMNPPPPALQGYDHPTLPGIGGVNVVEGRVLSLSLSSSSHNLEAGEEFRPEHGGRLLFSQGGGGGGVVSELRNSKYAKAAQELLKEFCGVVWQRGQFTVTGELTPSAHENPTSNSNTTRISRPPLSASDRTEHRRRKVKLLSMLDEADNKYGHYCEQIQMVANSFDSIMGLGASKPYTSLAREAMSRHFRCLRDAIATQLKHSCALLGEGDDDDDSACVRMSSSKGETPRLKIIERSLRQQRAFLHHHHQMGQQQEEGWRPQRGLPERSVNILRSWLFEHFLHPYPSDAHKRILARQTGLSRTQVSNWFINARVRLWKPMVEDMYQQEAKEDGEKSGMDSSPNTSRNHHIYDYDNASIAPPPPPAMAAVAPPSPVVLATEMDDDKSCEMNNNGQESGDPSPLLDSEAAGHIIGPSVAAGEDLVVRLGNGSSGDVSLTLGLRHHGNLPGKNVWS